MYTVSSDTALRCQLCFHRCAIKPGESGFCHVRFNSGGSLALPFYGKISSSGMDPIEKKPFYHYRPGTSIYSLGYWGCNLHCPFCQNWTISQTVPALLSCPETVTPSHLIRQLQDSGLDSICHTYSEPSIHFEYLSDCAELAKDSEIKSVLVTNGSILEKPARELYAKMAAVNIDLKSMNPEYYAGKLHGNLNTVLENIRIAASLTHLEVTCLIVPGNNDSIDEMVKAASFLQTVEQCTKTVIPLHISRYFPGYKQKNPPVSPSLLKDIQKECLNYLPYVYLGNTNDPVNTYCHRCGSKVIHRDGYYIKRLFKELSGAAVCQNCGERLPVIL